MSAMDLIDGTELAWDDTAMSGTAKRVTDWVTLEGRVRDICGVLTWTNTGTVAGAFGMEASNDGGTTVATLASPTVPAVSNNAGPGAIERACSARQVRFTYTNASGTGVLSPVFASGTQSA